MISGTKIHNKVLAAQVKKILHESKSARAPLRHKQVDFIGNRLLSPVGDYIENFAHSIANRIIDIFDYCILLIKHRRFPSACVLSRGIIETYAYALYARHCIVDAFETGGIEAAGSKILAFTNSSFFKTKSQEEFKAGVFEGAPYYFTEEAMNRMKEESANAIPIGLATRFFFDEQMQITGKTESSLEIIYTALCEWSHPSQTSLLQNYATDLKFTKTSFGLVHVHDHAIFLTVGAMHFITDLNNIIEDLCRVAAFLNSQRQPFVD